MRAPSRAPWLLAALAACSGHGDHVADGVAEGVEQMERMKAAAAYDLALQQFRSGRLDEALLTAERVCASDPSVPFGHVLRGRILFELGRPAEALAALERACSLDPESARPHYLRGVVLEDLGRLEDAAAAYRRAASLEPDRIEAWLAAAEALVDLGRRGEAERLLRESGRVHPGIRQLQGHLALLDGDLDRARARFEEALLLDPEDAGVREDLARVLMLAGRHGEAAIHLRRLVGEDPSARPDLALLLARALLDLDDPVGARAALLPLLERRESGPEVAASLADAAAMLEDDRLLERAGRRLAALAPDDPRGPLALAFALMLRGEPAAAAAQLERARALGCDEAAAAELEEWIARASP